MIALLLAASVAAAPCAPRLEGISTPTGAFATDGTLWMAWVDGPHVCVGASKDRGATFASAVAVNAEPEPIDANGEARPKLALSPKGDIYVSYTRKLAKLYTGEIRFSRSTDGGRTFSSPMRVGGDEIASGRFDTLAVAPDGAVYLFWIAEVRRDEPPSEEGKQPTAASEHAGGHGHHAPASLYAAISTDGGATFPEVRPLKNNVCECCRLASAVDGATPVLMWRDIMDGGVRDHALARISDLKAPTIARATDDGWEIAGCPHAGPALASSDGLLHLAWFTGAGAHGAGTFYRRSADGGRTFSTPLRMGGDHGTARPTVSASGRNVWVAWREALDEETSGVFAMHSADAGGTWTKAREIARTRGDSDHPLLLVRGDDAYLSWLSKSDGYRLLLLPRD
jgi:hypothetical protein